jgi:hypothetical protein
MLEKIKSLLSRIHFKWMIFCYQLIAVMLFKKGKASRFRGVCCWDGSKLTSDYIQACLDRHLVVMVRSLDGNLFICHGDEHGKLKVLQEDVEPTDDRFLALFPQGGNWTGIACYPGTREPVYVSNGAIFWAEPNAMVPLVVVPVNGDLYTFEIPEDLRKLLKLPVATKTK